MTGYNDSKFKARETREALERLGSRLAPPDVVPALEPAGRGGVPDPLVNNPIWKPSPL